MLPLPLLHAKSGASSARRMYACLGARFVEWQSHTNGWMARFWRALRDAKDNSDCKRKCCVWCRWIHIPYTVNWSFCIRNSRGDTLHEFRCPCGAILVTGHHHSAPATFYSARIDAASAIFKYWCNKVLAFSSHTRTLDGFFKFYYDGYWWLFYVLFDYFCKCSFAAVDDIGGDHTNDKWMPRLFVLGSLGAHWKTIALIDNQFDRQKFACLRYFFFFFFLNSFECLS